MGVSSIGRPQQVDRGVAGEVRPELGFGQNLGHRARIFVRKPSWGVPGRAKPASSRKHAPVAPIFDQIKALSADFSADFRATSARTLGPSPATSPNYNRDGPELTPPRAPNPHLTRLRLVLVDFGPTLRRLGRIWQALAKLGQIWPRFGQLT